MPLLVPVCCSLALRLVLWCCWLGIRKSIRHVEIEWWGAGVVICLEWGAYDLHMMQLMPLPPPIISCFIIIQIGLIFLMSAYPWCSLAVWCSSVTYGSVLTALSFHHCLPFRCTLFVPIFFCYIPVLSLWYRDGNTAEENSNIFSLIWVH